MCYLINGQCICENVAIYSCFMSAVNYGYPETRETDIKKKEEKATVLIASSTHLEVSNP